MTFSEYAENWRTRQRHVVDYSTGRSYRSHLTTHLYPELGDYRIEATSPLTIERFITGMERRNVKPGTLHNVYGLLRTVPPDAVRKGAVNSDPTLGIKTRPYIPPRSVIPTVEYTTVATRKADAQLGLVITMMRGCGLRNVEARAVNINNVISDDIYRVSDQIHHNTYRPAPLKHRHPGEFRDVPLPRSVRETIERIERIEQRHGTTDEGCLLRGPNGYFTYGIESTRAATLHATLPPPKGMPLSGYRDLSASVCLEHGIPITDVSEWLGHRNIETTYRSYRHLMPASIARAGNALDHTLAT
ncbi:tyrosine-type recombinase/integrase [Streptomyces nigrescens]|uniref:tyrosine-type recombinase/integrase n=1 Tax=Streptomyces nigrescens TaxID=1920 RepID=UPI003479865F